MKKIIYVFIIVVLVLVSIMLISNLKYNEKPIQIAEDLINDLYNTTASDFEEIMNAYEIADDIAVFGRYEMFEEYFVEGSYPSFINNRYSLYPFHVLKRGASVSVIDIDMTEKNTSEINEMIVEFNTSIKISYGDSMGEESVVSQKGVIVFNKVENSWKVKTFRLYGYPFK